VRVLVPELIIPKTSAPLHAVSKPKPGPFVSLSECSLLTMNMRLPAETYRKCTYVTHTLRLLRLPQNALGTCRRSSSISGCQRQLAAQATARCFRNDFDSTRPYVYVYSPKRCCCWCRCCYNDSRFYPEMFSRIPLWRRSRTSALIPGNNVQEL
jgi:hypothetical protein